MPISSYVIRCAPGEQARVLSELLACPGVEIGEASPAGIAVATETSTTRAVQELGECLERLPGVKSAVLVYHNFEDVADEAATLPQHFRTA